MKYEICNGLLPVPVPILVDGHNSIGAALLFSRKCLLAPIVSPRAWTDAPSDSIVSGALFTLADRIFAYSCGSKAVALPTLL